MNVNNSEIKKKRPFLVIVMGVSGSGKTTIAKKLSELNSLQFVEGDDFHSIAAVEKMTNGIALQESDRKPWISAMCKHFQKLVKTKVNCCLAYSGLIAAHRKQFTALGYQVVFIQLSATLNILQKRLSARTDHFFDNELLNSQFEALELPTQQENIFQVDIEDSIDDTLLKAQQILLREIYGKER